ncbi:hypothetical protein [Deinococcus sp.]|uniref:hypothetical protein n=1 Tax=Deinococcus sp. TaxID=47478 RepID=UPI0025F88B37|nr:hypothetical protein [Deinococcus sp.]
MRAAWEWVVGFLNLPMTLFYRKIFIFYGLAACCDLVAHQFVFQSTTQGWWYKAQFFFSAPFIVLIAIKIAYEFIKWLIQTIRDRIRVGYW